MTNLEKKLHSKVQQLLAENEKLRGNVPDSQYLGVYNKMEKYKKIIESAEFNVWLAHKKRCKKNNLKSYFFAFDREEFDAFVEKIKVKPNAYFNSVIKDEIKK